MHGRTYQPVVCVHVSVFFALCMSRCEVVSSLKMWVPTARLWSALCSHLGCLLGRQELVGSMDNLLASPRRLLSAMRLFLPLPRFGGLRGPGKRGLSGPVMDALCQESAGQAAREGEAAWARLKRDGDCY